MIINSEPTNHVTEWTLHTTDAIECHSSQWHVLSKWLKTITLFPASNKIVFFITGLTNNFTANFKMRYESYKTHGSGDEPSPYHYKYVRKYLNKTTSALHHTAKLEQVKMGYQNKIYFSADQSWICGTVLVQAYMFVQLSIHKLFCGKITPKRTPHDSKNNLIQMSPDQLTPR